MRSLAFKESKNFSLGIELEYQIINPTTFNLIAQSKELIRRVHGTPFEKFIKPEITQGMLEINSGIHLSPNTLSEELIQIRQFLIETSADLKVLFCGGGTHPFQKWRKMKIFPTRRYRKIYFREQYLGKRDTVFGLHVHVGCSNSENALYLTHALARYVPQLIALSASSPFCEGVDTGYHSARITIFNTSAFYGTIPYMIDWKEFSEYFFKMQQLGIIESMKDFYWDIRPKPEFGTVEVRVCDVPLTFQKAILLAAYIQTLSCYILEKRPCSLNKDIYLLHSYNRFQSARYGLDGFIINPYTYQKTQIYNDILETMELLVSSAAQLGNNKYLADLKLKVIDKKSDAFILRAIWQKTKSLKEMVREQCRQWLLEMDV